MNSSQLTGIARIVVVAALSSLLGKYLPQNIIADIATAVVTIGVGAWSAIDHTPKAMAQAVSSPDVKVVVGPGADPSLQLAARDPTLPNIVQAK